MNSEKRSEYLKNWRATRGKEYHSDWYKANKQSRVLYNRLRKFGITHEEFIQLLDKQNGRCPLCDVTLSYDLSTQKNTCVDHDHRTGKIRGVLCRLCNTMLGSAKDNITTLENSIKYLKESS